MGFHDIRFPESISWGSSHASGYKHQVIELPTGAEEIVSTQSLVRYRFDVAEGVKSNADAAALRLFYNARHGLSNSFRFKDWSDYTSNSDGVTAATNADQNIGTGDGITKSFQLRKAYGDAAATEYRTITKPVDATTVIAVNGVAQVSPGWTYPWTVNTTTGMVTFTTAPPASQAVTAGFQFDCEVRFGSSVDDGLDISQDAYESNSLRVPLIEKFPAAPVDDFGWYRGAAAFSGSADITISKATGAVITFSPTGPYSAFLPPKANLPLGGEHYWLHNASGTHNITIKDGDDSSTVATLTNTAGATPNLTMLLGVTTGGARYWIALS